MNRRRVTTLSVTLSLALALVFGGVAFGQAKGNLYGSAADNQGQALPGVTVTLTGLGAEQTQITDAQGVFRFFSLDPGSYKITAMLDGFGGLEYPNIAIQANRNASVSLTMIPAVEETLTVTSESPLLDERKLTTGTSVSQIELEKIPSGRDPWALLAQTPGVQVDRINVGGNEGGQQSVFVAQGVGFGENDFQMDGTSITDMRATGASPTYYDFDQFAEISFSTGGADITKNTAGVQVNMVTKRGGNEFRGSARFNQVNAKGIFNGFLKQADPNISGELNRPGQTSLTGAKIRKIQEVGMEAGGAAVKDRLWFWGSWGQSDIDQNAATGDADDTLLENTSLKTNAQFTQSNSAMASWNNGDKQKNGRGAGPTRSPQSLWDQRGPSAIYRAEDTHVFSSNFFLTGSYSFNDFGFALLARGDVGTDGLDPASSNPRYEDGIWQDNFLSGAAKADPSEFKLDASYFFNTGNTNHELKIGGRFREYTSFSFFSWGPRNVFSADWGATIARHSTAGPATVEYGSIWAQDTMTFGKLTLNVGLRIDQQTGYNEAQSVGAHAVLPDILPAFSVAKSKNVEWDSIVPRVGVTYALGEKRNTLLRASFSQFADQMGTGLGAWSSPTYYGWYAYFSGYNPTFADLYASTYFDPLNPTTGANRFSPGGIDPPITTELLLGVEHALRPELVVGLNITARNISDILDQYQLVRDGNGGVRAATFSDYSLRSTLTGQVPRNGGSYSVPVFDLIGRKSPTDPTAGAPSGGLLWANGQREKDYLGGSVTFTKRLANRWMARGFFGWGKAEWSVPSNFAGCPNGFANNWRGGGCRDGDIHSERATGSGKGERFLQSSYNFNLNGMYQVAPDRPWGFNVAASVTGREGQPIGYYRNTSTTGGTARIPVVDVDAFRLEDPYTIDLRLEKEFGLSSAMNLTFALEGFNITNEGTGLSYQPSVTAGSAGNIQDNVSPRVYRLGVRLAWR